MNRREFLKNLLVLPIAALGLKKVIGEPTELKLVAGLDSNKVRAFNNNEILLIDPVPIPSHTKSVEDSLCEYGTRIVEQHMPELDQVLSYIHNLDSNGDYWVETVIP